MFFQSCLILLDAPSFLVPPAITKTDSSHTDYVKIAKSNEDAEIRCIVKRSNPLPKFRWFRLIGNQWTEDFEKVSKNLSYCYLIGIN